MTPSESGTVTYTHDGYIGTVEFYHPKGNSMPGELLRQLTEAITRAGVDEQNRVVVLKSRGEGAFCAGASFDELLAISDPDEGKRFFMGFANVLNAMRTCPKMIITRVQGKTVGGGVGIAAAADFTVAAADASVKLSEISLGIGPFVVGPPIGRKIGTSAFATLALDAKSWYSAEWAYEKGLFNKLVSSPQELDEAVQSLAGSLASANPEALRELKEITWQGTGHWHSTLEQRAEISGRLVLSGFTREFIEKFKKG